MQQGSPPPRKKIFVPPQRPAPEPTPSESGTLAGFTRQQAELATAGDLFETIKTARQRAADAARGDAAQMAIDHAMAVPLSPLQRLLQNKRAMYGLASVVATAVVFAIVSGLSDPKTATPKAAMPKKATEKTAAESHVAKPAEAPANKPVFSSHSVNRVAPARPSTSARPTAPSRPTYFPTSHSHEGDAQPDDRRDEDPPPLLDDFQIEPVSPPPPEPVPDDAPNMPPPGDGAPGGPADIGQ